MNTTDKVLTLAFHPSTSEHEAIAAFLRARALMPNGYEPQIHTIKKQTPLSHVSYDATIVVKKVPLLLEILNNWVSNFENSRYIIDVKSKSWNAIGSIELEIKMYTNNITQFKIFFESAFKLI